MPLRNIKMAPNAKIDHALNVVTLIQVLTESFIEIFSHFECCKNMWKWWLKRPKLLVEQMNVCLNPFGVRDLKLGIAEGQYKISETDVEIILGQITWMLVGGVIDILENKTDGLDEVKLIKIIMRAMGVSHDYAKELAEMELPSSSKPNIDFSDQPLPVLSVLFPEGMLEKNQ